MPMRIHVFDVEHGACAAIETPTGHLLMLDCGHNASTGWRPSDWAADNFGRIDILNITNVDEDHVSDLPNITQRCRPHYFSTNQNLSGRWILARKGEESGAGPGVRETARYIDEVFTGTPQTHDLGVERFKFSHGTDKFTDFNNLSLVTFLFLGEFGIIFPGDLERDGWLEFLNNEQFRQCLSRTSIFVASHHGRDNGYEPAVFDLCSPYIVLMSDKATMYDTQETAAVYGSHANGLAVDNRIRKVLTTRNDGKLTIDVYENGGFLVETATTRSTVGV